MVKVLVVKAKVAGLVAGYRARREGVAMIVVVNNERGVREGLQRALERAGYAVRAFERGADALQDVAWSAVELVISDRTNFPMDGVAFVHRVRERSDVPVVFVSAWAAELEEELRGSERAAGP